MYYLTLIIIILTVLNCLWGALRTNKKTVFVICATVITGVLSMLLAKPVGLLFNKPLLSFIFFFLPKEADESLVYELVSLIIKPITATLVYIPLFIVIYLLMKIPVALLSSEKAAKKTAPADAPAEETPAEEAAVPESHSSGIKDSMLSIALSGANCLLFFFLLFLPYSGMVGCLSEDMSALQQVRSENSGIQSFVKELDSISNKAEQLTGDPLLHVYSTLGGKKLYLTYAKLKRSGAKTNLHEEVLNICDVFCKTATIVTDTRLKLTSETARNISKAKDTLFDSVFLKNILYDFLDDASSKWAVGDRYMGFVPNQLFTGSPSAEKISDVITLLVDYLNGSTDKQKDSLFTSLTKGLSLAANSGIFNAERSASGSFIIADENDGTVYAELIRVVDENTALLCKDIIELISENREGYLLGLLVKNMGSIDDSEADTEGDLIYRFFSKLQRYLDEESISVSQAIDLLEIAATSKVLAPSFHELCFEKKYVEFSDLKKIDDEFMFTLFQDCRSQSLGNSILKSGTILEDAVRFFGLGSFKTE